MAEVVAARARTLSQPVGVLVMVTVAVVVVAMCVIQMWDVHFNKAVFKPNDFGVGVGAVLTGFAAYLYGDAKRPDPSSTSSVQVSQTTTS